MPPSDGTQQSDGDLRFNQPLPKGETKFLTQLHFPANKKNLIQD